MSIRSLAAMAALVVFPLLAISSATAQENQRGRGGPGGFGRGMTRSFDTTMVDLLRVAEVRKEIEITTEQEGLLTKLAERQREERPEINFRDASDEDRQKFMETVSKQATETKEKVEEILDPSQFERLEQLTVQSLGVNGLANSPELAKKVGITADQVEKMKTESAASAENMRTRMSEIFQSGDREGVREKMQEIRKEQDNKLLAMLTAEQKAEYEKLKGKAFEFPEMGRGGFGGDRGGNGAGGDRGNRGEGGNRPGGGRPAAE